MGDRRTHNLPTFSQNVCVILVNPEHDGNIGAVARSMLNFGINDLRVVGRDSDWSEEARRRAKNAQTVLDGAKVVDTFTEAVADCSLVVGTSGKREKGEKTAKRHYLLPEELPQRLSGIEGRVAIVFGPEGKGLLNEQLLMCDLLVTVPTWEGYPILNLSHAVSIICFSWYVNSDTTNPPGTEGRLLNPKLRAKLRSEIETLIAAMPTKDHKRKGMENTLLRVLFRGLPKDDEIHRILGIVTQAADLFEQT